MRAKCPFCDYGCNLCEDGYFESKLADGPIIILECNSPDCGFIGGAHILNPELPPPPDNNTCVLCNYSASWILFGWSAPSPLDTDNESGGFILP